MNEHKFAQLLGNLDPALIARAEAPVRKTLKPGLKIALVAAALALVICAALPAVSFIPKTLDLDYPDAGDQAQSKNAWVYYTTEDDKQKREYVRLPASAENVFLAWAHLNGLGEDCELIEMASTENTGFDRQIILTLSPTLGDRPDSETLLTSLKSTFAAYYGIPKKNVTVYFAKDPVTLEFSHDLTDTPVRLKSGDLFTVTVTMTNVSDEDIVYEGSHSDFIPKAKLLAKSIIYVATEIFPIQRESTDEFAQYRLAPGESKSFTYTFRIPEATSSVTVTGHDLTVYFGEQSKTFENVTSVIYTYAASGAKSAFESFALAHTSENRTELQSIWDSYTYQGENIMDQMQVLSGDGEHLWFEQGECELFAYYKGGTGMEYEWLSFYSYSFTAQVLPDGMTLPMGITEQDSVLDVLIKMGVDEQTALDYLAKQGTVMLAGSSFSDATSSIIPDFRGTINLVCNPNNYVIQYICDKGIIAASDPYMHATRTVSLTYDRDSQSFLSLRIGVNLPTRPDITFDALPTFTEVDGKETSITLTQEQSDALHQAMTLGKWQAYEADAEYNCQGMIGNIEFEYASATGHLTVGGFTVQLYATNMRELNEILGTPLTLE